MLERAIAALRPAGATRIALLAAGMVTAAMLAGSPAATALQGWHFGIAGCAFALLLWIGNHRRYRAIVDTPRAPLASAPQGFVEICGVGRALPGAPVLSPLNGLPCLWYRVVHEVRDKRGWRKVAEDTSDASFIVEDASGARCCIDPTGAQVATSSRDVANEGDHRTTQWLLVAGTRIHALGHFLTHSHSADRPSLNTEVRDKLADWKASGDAMRFDLDGNGELSLGEWDLARAAARREARRERVDAASMPDVHHMVAPADGRSFIITDMDPARLATHYRHACWASLAGFFAALAATSWLWTNR